MIQALILRNFKGLNGRFELSDKTILIGMNGTGKSGILEATKILISGYSENGKKASAVLEYGSGEVVEISGESGQGQILTRKFFTKGASGSQEISLNGEVVLEKNYVAPPDFDFPVEAIHPTEFLALSGDKRAAWLTAALGSKNLSDSIGPEEITVSFPWFKGTMSASEILEKIADESKKTKEEIDRCKANLQRLTGLSENLPSGTLHEWEEKRKAVEAQLEKLLKDQASREQTVKLFQEKETHKENLQKQLDNASRKCFETRNQIRHLEGCMNVTPDAKTTENLKKEIEILETGAQKRFEDKHKAKSRMNELLARCEVFKTKKTCPTCGASAEHMGPTIEEWEFEIVGLESTLETIETEETIVNNSIKSRKADLETANKNRDLVVQMKVLNDALKSYEKTESQFKTDLEALQAEKQTTEAGIDLSPQIEGLRAAKTEAIEAIKKFNQSQGIKIEKSKAEDDRQTLTGLLESLKKAEKEVKKIRDEKLEKIIGPFQKPFKTLVEASFPGSESYVSIFDGKGKPSLDFGIIRNGKQIGFSTMSGGEKAIFLASVIAAIQVSKCGKPRLGLFELAEVDSLRIKDFIKGVESLGFEQILAATCHNSEAPGTWTRILLEK